MKLDKYTQDLLKECALNRTRLIVNGANGIGQSIKVEGCINVLDIYGGYPDVNEGSFSLYQGWKEHKSLYCSTSEFKNYKDIPYVLHVESVTTENGKVIFRNEDFKKIINDSVSNMSEYLDPLTEEGKRWLRLLQIPVIVNFENALSPVSICISAVYMKNGDIILQGRGKNGPATLIIDDDDKYTVSIDESVKTNLDLYIAKNKKNKR